MFQRAKTTSLILFFGLILLLVSGCSFFGSKNNPVAPGEKTKEAEKTSETLNLPRPTGKADDVVSAINSEVDSENAEISAQENVAASSVTDDQETSDFNQVYNENEF
jgi:hypothetical protein